jgi:hypothetical protein
VTWARWPASSASCGPTSWRGGQRSLGDDPRALPGHDREVARGHRRRGRAAGACWACG